MTDYRIEGPFPLTVRATADGATLDISLFLVRGLLLELFQSAAGDPQGFGEEFADMHQLALSAQHQGPDSHARHEFDERVQAMVDAYADGGLVPLYAGGLRQLRDALDLVLAPREVPGQRGAA
jgi:hypothetical protein